MDKAAAVCAMRHARTSCVTVSVDRVDFREPILVGDLVHMKASVNFVGRSTMEIGIRIEAENMLLGTRRHTNSCYVTYVALDRDGRPTEVPSLVLETDAEVGATPRERSAAGGATKSANLRRPASKKRAGPPDCERRGFVFAAEDLHGGAREQRPPARAPHRGRSRRPLSRVAGRREPLRVRDDQVDGERARSEAERCKRKRAASPRKSKPASASSTNSASSVARSTRARDFPGSEMERARPSSGAAATPRSASGATTTRVRRRKTGHRAPCRRARSRWPEISFASRSRSEGSQE